MRKSSKNLSKYLVVLLMLLGVGSLCLFMGRTAAKYTMELPAGELSLEVKPEAFAIYSEDDQSLRFYKRAKAPEAGETFEGRTVSAVYTGVETTEYKDTKQPEWKTYTENIEKVIIHDTITPISTAYWFAGFVKIEEVAGLDTKLDGINLISMSNMFSNCTVLKSADLSNLYAPKLVEVQGLFSNCLNLLSVNISGLEHSPLENTYYMFGHCESLETLDVSALNTSKVSSMHQMFSAMQKVRQITFGPDFRFDGNGTATECVMPSLQYVTGADGNWYTTGENGTVVAYTPEEVAARHTSTDRPSEAVTYYAIKKEVPHNHVDVLDNADTSNQTADSLCDICDLWIVPEGATYYRGVNTTALGNYEGATETYVSTADKLAVVPTAPTAGDVLVSGDYEYRYQKEYSSYHDWRGKTTGWGVRVLDAEKQKYNDPLFGINSELLTSMSCLYYKCLNLTELNTVAWDVSKVTNFSSTFRYCRAAEQLDLGNWNTAKADNMEFMFGNMDNLKQITLGPDFKFVTGENIADYTLPTPDSTKIPGADGNWYCMTENGLLTIAPTEIPTKHAELMAAADASPVTYYVLKTEACPHIDNNADEFCDLCNCWIVPEGGTYYRGISYTVNGLGDYTGATEVYAAGEVVPTVAEEGDIYTVSNGDYEYRYKYDYHSDAIWNRNTKLDGWGVILKDRTKSEYLQPVLSINGANIVTYKGLFQNILTLTELNLTSWNTEDIISMNGLFMGCTNLSSLNISGWNTGKVTDMTGMFNGCKSLETLDGSDFDTSNVTTMANMFTSCSKLKVINSENWKTDKVTHMGAMFNGCSSLQTLTVDSWNTEEVIYMHGMFWGCGKLERLDVSNWNTGKVINMGGLFHSCALLSSLDVSKWDTKNVTSMSSMFFGCENLTKLDVSNFDTTKVQNMDHMFRLCKRLTELDVNSLETNALTTSAYMFNECDALSVLTIDRFVGASNQKMTGMFSGCDNLAVLDIRSLSTENVINMDKLFDGSVKLQKIVLGEKFAFKSDESADSGELPTPTPEKIPGANGYWYYWDGNVIKHATPTELITVHDSASQAVTYYATMPEHEHKDANVDNYCDICGGWIVPMDATYYRNVTVNSINSTGYSGEEVTAISEGEVVLTAPQEGDVLVLGDYEYRYQKYSEKQTRDNITTDTWKTMTDDGWGASVIDRTKETYGTPVFTINGKNLTHTSYMFYECTSINTFNGTGWDTSNVTDMRSMFQRVGYDETTKAVDMTIDLTGWDVSKVKYMDAMFNETGAKTTASFKILGLADWDVSSVISMSSMFQNTAKNAETVDLGDLNTKSVTKNGYTYLAWDVKNVTRMNAMFRGVGYSAQSFNIGKLDNWNVSKVTTMSSMFYTLGVVRANDWNIGDLSTKEVTIDGITYTAWDVSNVNSMDIMFSFTGDKNAYLGNLNTWNVSKVKNFSGMFKGFEADALDLSSWDTKNALDMSEMFNNCSTIKTLDLSGFDTTNVTKIAKMFDTTSFEKIILGSNFSFTAGETSCQLPDTTSGYWYYWDGNVIKHATPTELITVHDSASQAVTYYATMPEHEHKNEDSDEYCDICGFWIVPECATYYRGVTDGSINSAGYAAETGVTTLSAGEIVPTTPQEGDVFVLGDYEYRYKKQVSINSSSDVKWSAMEDNGWGVRAIDKKKSTYGNPIFCINDVNVTSMRAMFRLCDVVTEIQASDWDVSNVTNMAEMFSQCGELVTLNVSGWNTENVKDMGGMFDRSPKIEKLDVSTWKTGNVEAMGYMFRNCWKLTELDVSNWDTSNVKVFWYMFHSCYELKEIDVSDWNTDNATHMEAMFAKCWAITSLDLTKFNTKNVSEIYGMFDDCRVKSITLGENFDFTAGETSCQLPDTTSGYWYYWDKDVIKHATPTELITVHDSASQAVTYYATMPEHEHQDNNADNYCDVCNFELTPEEVPGNEAATYTVIVPEDAITTLVLEEEPEDVEEQLSEEKIEDVEEQPTEEELQEDSPTEVIE